MEVSLYFGGKSHVSNRRNVSFKEACPISSRFRALNGDSKETLSLPRADFAICTRTHTDFAKYNEMSLCLFLLLLFFDFHLLQPGIKASNTAAQEHLKCSEIQLPAIRQWRISLRTRSACLPPAQVVQDTVDCGEGCANDELLPVPRSGL